MAVIPEWVPLALQMYGAVSGDQSVSRVGSLAGGIRTGQLEDIEKEALLGTTPAQTPAPGNVPDVEETRGMTLGDFTKFGGKITLDDKGMKMDVPQLALDSLGKQQKKPQQLPQAQPLRLPEVGNIEETIPPESLIQIENLLSR